MKNLILLIAFGLICSCDRLGQKAEQTKEVVEEKTKEEISKLTEKAANKIFPPFDADKPDTDNNKKRFTDFLKVDLTEDIKNIFCFDDAVGIDADYMFSFNCDSTTSKKIINVNKLTIDKVNKDCGFGMQNDFKWWDKNKIKSLQKYSWTNNDRYFKYFWYDHKDKKAYYFEFDM
jgi:hypothetical protein